MEINPVSFRIKIFNNKVTIDNHVIDCTNKEVILDFSSFSMISKLLINETTIQGCSSTKVETENKTKDIIQIENVFKGEASNNLYYHIEE